MESTFDFKTVEKEVSDVWLKEKGSKFIGFLSPVNGEEEAKMVLEKIKSEHPKATHHCYAFRLGENGQIYRANDDGEPSGSAGLPIYNQLLAHEITNVILVVVRYYGGTKLGVGGLVKVYKETAQLTIEQAIIIQKNIESSVKITFGFDDQNTVFVLLNKFQAKITSFETTATESEITASFPLSEKENISEKLSEMHKISFQFL